MRNPYRKFYTYLHCKPDGTPFYVGKGYRWRAFRVDVFRNAHHSNVVKKYGIGNIKVYIFQCGSETEALDDEVRWIAQLRAEGIRLTNQTSGGDGMRDPTPEVREKLSRLAMGNKWMTGKKLSAEWRQRISAAQKGRPGKKASSETRAKMSASRMGHIVSPETRQKISASNMGRVRSEESKAKHSASITGRKLSAEHKAKIGASLRKHNAQVAA